MRHLWQFFIRLMREWSPQNVSRLLPFVLKSVSLVTSLLLPIKVVLEETGIINKASLRKSTPQLLVHLGRTCCISRAKNTRGAKPIHLNQTVLETGRFSFLSTFLFYFEQLVVSLLYWQLSLIWSHSLHRGWVIALWRFVEKGSHLFKSLTSHKGSLLWRWLAVFFLWQFWNVRHVLVYARKIATAINAATTKRHICFRTQIAQWHPMFHSVKVRTFWKRRRFAFNLKDRLTLRVHKHLLFNNKVWFDSTLYGEIIGRFEDKSHWKC